MNIVKRATLEAFWSLHPEAEQPLREWFRTAKLANWTSMADVKATYAKASIINRERVVFNICGGNYRLIVAFKFSARLAFIKFIGSHAEYDRIDAATIDHP